MTIREVCFGWSFSKPYRVTVAGEPWAVVPLRFHDDELHQALDDAADATIFAHSASTTTQETKAYRPSIPGGSSAASIPSASGVSSMA